MAACEGDGDSYAYENTLTSVHYGLGAYEDAADDATLRKPLKRLTAVPLRPFSHAIMLSCELSAVTNELRGRSFAQRNDMMMHECSYEVRVTPLVSSPLAYERRWGYASISWISLYSFVLLYHR